MELSYQVVLILLCLGSISKQVESLNECERGVKRHHPSQANIYQLFTRSSLLKQWIDYECQKFTIFDPRKCACVEKPAQNKKTTTDPDDSKSPAGNGESQIAEIKKTNTVKQEKGPPSGEKEENCHLHQPSSKNPSHFERWADGQWVVQDCNFPFYTGLVWKQELCRCEWGANRTAPIAVQESAIPAVCLMMLHVTFDDGDITDQGRGVWIDVKNHLEAAAVQDDTAVGGYSGSFRGASMRIPFFKSNIIGPTFHVGFQFKLCQGTPDTDIFLVNNDCPDSDDGPSMVVSYQAWKQQLVVAMRTLGSEAPVDVYCAVKNPGPQKSWVKVDIRYHDNYLEVTANDEVCAADDSFHGPLATNNCPLTLLGESFCGKIDEVIITRGCTEAHAIS